MKTIIMILTIHLRHLKQINATEVLDFWNIDGNVVANIMQGVGAPEKAGHQYNETKLQEYVDKLILAKLPSRYNSYRVESWEFRDHADKEHNNEMSQVATPPTNVDQRTIVAEAETKSPPRHIPPKRPFKFPSLSPASHPYSALALLGV
jgi:hypothetical protein